MSKEEMIQKVDEWWVRISYSLRNKLDFNEPDPRGPTPSGNESDNNWSYDYTSRMWVRQQKKRVRLLKKGPEIRLLTFCSRSS